MSQKLQTPVGPPDHLYKSCSEVRFLSAQNFPPESSRVSQLFEDFNLPRILTRLLNDLDDAFAGSPNNKSVESLRAQYVAALAGIHRFLYVIDRKHAEQFLILGDAVADLNLGALWPMLAPSKKRKSLIASRLRVARAHVVFALNVLIDDIGIPKHDAAKEVLKKFPGIRHLAAGKSKSWKQVSKTDLPETILRWRTDLNAPSRHRSDAVKRVLTGREVIDSIKDVCTPEELREAAYKSLRNAERVGVCLTEPVRLSRLAWTQLF